MTKNMKVKRDIERRRKEIDALEADIKRLSAELEMKRVYLEAVINTAKQFDDTPEEVSSKEIIMRSGSELSKVREILSNHGKPLYITDILIALGKEPTPKNKVSLAGSLSAYVRDRKVFVKSGPNTFGLIEYPASTNVVNIMS